MYGKKSDLPLLRCAYAVYDDDFYLAPFPYSSLVYRSFYASLNDEMFHAHYQKNSHFWMNQRGRKKNKNRNRRSSGDVCDVVLCESEIWISFGS